ncbi:hypothetical protein AVEN_117026-1, partial [Araneus ventricosus]
LEYYKTSGGLMVGSQLRSRRATGSKPDSTENPPCMWAQGALNLTRLKRPFAGVVQKFEEGGASSGVVLVI